MALFPTHTSPTTRRLLFVVGFALLGIGLLWSWLADGAASPEDLAETRERVALIHDRQTEGLDLVETDADDGVPAPAADEMRALRARLDFEAAPRPLPQRVEEKEYELFVGTTGEFLAWLFDTIGYTAEQVASGATEAIPPVVVVRIPKGWADDRSVQMKKSLFYRTLLPLILLENDDVLADRASLEAYRRKRVNRAPLTVEEHAQARALAVRYRVLDADSEASLDDDELAELLRRVDSVPPSLALAQAAAESGYATSRFAHTGNALFGQWDWSADAIKPLEQREGKGNYGIRAFPYPIDSVRAYLWNLNTHRAYEDFRRLRADHRDGRAGRVVHDGHALAGTLLSYSERGEEYTQEIQGIIDFNRLTLADDLRLLEGDPVYFD